VVWVQEEPWNMGPRKFIVPQIEAVLANGITVGDVSRPERSSPAEGYPAGHQAEQQRIVREAFAS
jgi:2-oxoglutarate dehydrogenase E1 component